MPLAQHLRRFPSALLAGLVLAAALGAAAHAHGGGGKRSAALEAAANETSPQASEIACALCTATARLGHAARAGHARAEAPARVRVRECRMAALAQPAPATSRTDARAPPAIG